MGFSSGPNIQVTKKTRKAPATDLIVCFEGNANLVGQTATIQIHRASPLTLLGQQTASVKCV